MQRCECGKLMHPLPGRDEPYCPSCSPSAPYGTDAMSEQDLILGEDAEAFSQFTASTRPGTFTKDSQEPPCPLPTSSGLSFRQSKWAKP